MKCIAPSGKHVIPYVITSQKSEDLREALRKKGIEFGRHLILTKSHKPDINNKFFTEYVKSTFIPHVARMPTKRGIEKEDAVLLM
jgi:hypothetical protein